MSHSRRLSVSLWRGMHRLNRRVSGNYRRGARLGRLVLLLTTTGRKTGLPRTTPLQYESVDGVIYVASARGQAADWFRNIVANPCVTVQIKGEQFEALAEPVTDPTRIADFLELRLKRHPIMLRLMLAAEGLPLRFDRIALERFAAQKALVAIRRREPEGACHEEQYPAFCTDIPLSPGRNRDRHLLSNSGTSH